VIRLFEMCKLVDHEVVQYIERSGKRAPVEVLGDCW